MDANADTAKLLANIEKCYREKTLNLDLTGISILKSLTFDENVD